MSAVHTWACFLLWISFSTQEKAPDVTVRCFISEECVLPCTFQPGREETVEWFKQEVLVFRFDRNSSSSSSKEHFKQQQLAERSSISLQQVSNGNATLVLRRSQVKDRGVYSCRVHTSEGEHTAKVVLKVEAPVRGLFLKLSRLSGYEEIKCTVRDVYPAPRVTWVTEPPTFEELRPVTRMQTDKMGLITVDSRLKRLKGKPDLLYICKLTPSYGGPAWTASLRETKISGAEGKDLTIPCRAPTYLNNPSLYWTFTRGEKFGQVVSYDSRTGRSVSSPPWDEHVELDVYRVPFGDGSLRLMDPKHLEHTGLYTCEFSLQYSKHTEHNQVTIGDPQDVLESVSPERDGAVAPPRGQVEVQQVEVPQVVLTSGGSTSGGSTGLKNPNSEGSSYWWIIGVVAAVLILALGGILAYLKLKRKPSKPRNNPDEETELNRLKDAAAP